MSYEAEKPTVRKVKVPAAKRAPERTAELRPNAILARSAAPPTPEQRVAMIAEAAYYRAEQRSFEAGQELQDWLIAENQIDAGIACGELPITPRS